MKRKKLSVLIITYNQEEYISKTLDSILNQKHNYEYEIVIGEDCSKDNTRKIIQDYFNKFPTIIKPIYNVVNLGLIKNYFTTLAACSGELIMECAGDDYWLDDKVSQQIEFMDKNPMIGMCYGQALCFINSRNTFEKKAIGKRKESFSDFILSNEVPAPTVCYRREIMFDYIKKINPLSKKWHIEDLPQWLWFSKHSKIAFLEKPLAVYRLMEKSCSHFDNLDEDIEYLDNVRDIKLFFSDTEEERNLINQLYYSDLANLYSNHMDLQNYRKYLRLSGTKHAKKRLIQSFIPFFLTLKHIISNNR